MTVYIYHGPWINWSHGPILGATLTLSSRNGGLLTAFIATYVTIVGVELWKLICYLVHQVRSKHTAQDGLYHQQQVILKNNTGPAGVAYLLLVQAWCWSGRARHSLLRTLPWAVFGLVYVGFFGVLAIFSSEISKSPGPMRLIMSDGCGIWRTNTSSPELQDAYGTKMVNETLAAATYAKSCYAGTHDPLVCGRFSVPSIPWTAKQNATCPFESGTCLWTDTAAYSMTSDLMDSHIHLGVNAPRSGRIQLEKSTTCAPLHTAGFAEVINATTNPEEFSNYGTGTDNILRYYYGSVEGMTNVTYYYNDHASWDQNPYSLYVRDAIQAQALNQGAFVPVQALNATNADLSLVFIAQNSVTYSEQCDDPIFAAHYRVQGESMGVQVDYYSTDRYVGVLGCSEQYRLCNPTTGECSESLGLMQLQAAVISPGSALHLNTLQAATASRLLLALQLSTVYYQTNSRQGASLRASESLDGLSQRYLPANQWQIEVGSWFDTGLARIQQKTLEYATGPAIVPEGSYVQRPNPTENPGDIPFQAMCYSQLINDNSETMSFSALGLGILLGFGFIIIIASLTIDTFVGWLQLKFGKGLYAREEWMNNDKLQLQRLLFEETQNSRWDQSKLIPVTAASGEKFTGPFADHSSSSGQVEVVQEQFPAKSDGAERGHLLMQTDRISGIPAGQP